MGAKKQITKLEKKIRKIHARRVLAVSDLRIQLEKEMYRADLAETKARFLKDELDALKLKVAILERTPTKKSNGSNAAAEVQSTEFPIAEIIAGTKIDS